MALAFGLKKGAFLQPDLSPGSSLNSFRGINTRLIFSICKIESGFYSALDKC
jgi:hypothetical protein